MLPNPIPMAQVLFAWVLLLEDFSVACFSVGSPFNMMNWEKVKRSGGDENKKKAF